MTPVQNSAPLLPGIPEDSQKDCAALDALQAILVTAEGSAARICCYERLPSGIWQACEAIGAIKGHVGRHGVRREKREGDGCTPGGWFRLGHAFGCRPKPETLMPYRPITPDRFWVDDPESWYYNTWVEGIDQKDWSSAEHLADYPDSYAYAAVIEYNMRPSDPGKGSAIFLHCGAAPTAGCVAVPDNAMLRLLMWLDPSKKPVIILRENNG